MTGLPPRPAASFEEAVLQTEQKKERAKALRMSDSVRRKHRHPCLKIDGVTLIYPGEVATFVAPPGSGKSQVCEAIASAFVCAAHNLAEIDTLGFEAYAYNDNKVLVIDTERASDDNLNSWERLKRRLKVSGNGNLMLKGEFKKLDYFMFAHMDTLSDIKNEFEEIVHHGRYGLVIIDGALDFVNSMNDEAECSEFVRWLRALAITRNMGIVVTLHPNKSQAKTLGNVAGHLGAMLFRFSRAMFWVETGRKNEGKKRFITTKAPQAKTSHGSGDIDYPFMWDDTEKMMLSAEYALPPANENDMGKPGRRDTLEAQIRGLFEYFVDVKGVDAVPAKDFQEEMLTRGVANSEVSARRKLAEAKEYDIIRVHGNARATTYTFTKWTNEQIKLEF